MLELKKIIKEYVTGGDTVRALNSVDLTFRENEFVSILGASGCGKTTMLNIIGGLDRYTSGDLIINGKSTKEFKDSDWDSYRNHSIGFVFQSYNLIPHQTVLSNVELALTLSGVSRTERRRRAIEALTKVGLGDQLNKKPNQMSGGQMQRVAIARALVNNPDILLADEPTGALDTHTSIQIMDLLKEVAEDRLVIMVTHNPELAEQYSTRIVRLQDGCIIDDSNPLSAEELAAAEQEIAAVKKEAHKDKKEKKKEKKNNKTSMSFLTAMSLSMNNLMTKKGRTILTSFAGSIGIIGIALILSLSNGIQGYIDQVQEDTLSTYPLSIQKETQDYSAMMAAMMEVDEEEDHSDSDKIYVDNSLQTMMEALSARTTNNIEDFKIYLEAHQDELTEYLSAIQYTYDMDLQVYSEDGKTRISPTTIFESMGQDFASVGNLMSSSGMGAQFNVFSEMLDNQELLDQQYDMVAGTWPKSSDEVVLVISKNNQISKMTLYMLGVLDQSEIEGMMESLMKGEKIESEEIPPFSFDDFLGMKFRLLNASDYYEKTEKTYTVDGKTYPVWQDIRELYGFDQKKFVSEHGTDLKIVGIIRPAEGVAATSISGVIGYSKGLTDRMLDRVSDNELISQQKATPDHNILTGTPFNQDDLSRKELFTLILSSPNTPAQFRDAILASFQITDVSQLAMIPDTVFDAIPEEQFNAMTQNASISSIIGKTTMEDNLKLFGDASKASPASINFYAKDFESKEKIEDFIKSYNDQAEEKDKLQYTDLVGVMMSSITVIINVISYVLVAFVSISLVVSSIMIGIITYISVLERTKEIGILRSIGASKKDISRVFNAETLIVGFAAGAIGILITVLLCLPINAIIRALSGIAGVNASLPWIAGIVLVLISMFLTFIAGLIPSKVASKKDPVEALRTE